MSELLRSQKGIRYWIGVASREHVRLGKKDGFAPSFAMESRVRSGDCQRATGLFITLQRKNFGNPCSARNLLPLAK